MKYMARLLYRVLIFDLVEENVQLFFGKARQIVARRARFSVPWLASACCVLRCVLGLISQLSYYQTYTDSTPFSLYQPFNMFAASTCFSIRASRVWIFTDCSVYISPIFFSFLKIIGSWCCKLLTCITYIFFILFF